MADYTLGTGAYGDVWLDSAKPTYNYGASIYLHQHSGPGLLRFDLSAIPAGSTCDSAVLHLYKGNAASSAEARTLSVYSIASANSDWIAGTKNGALAGSGEPCWDARKADGSGGVTTAWAGSAGCATSGTDYEATAMGTCVGNRSDAQYTHYEISLNLTRVAGWFGSPNTNYGMRIAWNNNSMYIISNDGASGYRPLLSVTYSSPTTAAHRLSLLGVGK